MSNYIGLLRFIWYLIMWFDLARSNGCSWTLVGIKSDIRFSIAGQVGWIGKWWKKIVTMVTFLVVENKFEFAFECHVKFISYGQRYSISICNLKLNVPVHVLRSHVLYICATLLICKENAQKWSSRWLCGKRKCSVFLHYTMALKMLFKKGEMIYLDNKCFKQSLYYWYLSRWNIICKWYT